MIGQTLAHFRVDEKIGSGGMGVVYRAKDTKLDRDVAIKVLRDELASDPDRLRRFEQEARAASALDHPNIVTIHDIAESEGIHYIVMQYVEGRTFRELLSDGPLPTEKILHFATPIAEGLAKAHAAGIIHRDLKPENLMVTSDGYVKILDFGLAKLLPQAAADSEAATITKEGTVAGAVMGTASYMSPEQALGKPLDTRTDVFSLGAVIYEMSTGRRPFSGDTAVALFDELLHATPPAPSSLNPQITAGLESIIHKALEKKPPARYPSAKELLVALKKAPNEPSIHESSTQKSIVVLPFENISPDPEQEYFCDGMTEEIISDLSKVEALHVISRSSAMTFKGTKKKVEEIADDVNVRYVLEGSVRKAGNNLRITAQLIEASNDAHLWAEKYSGTLDDVFDIQEKVSRSIVDALKVKLTAVENEKLAERPIENVQAYECYLKARQEMWKWTEEGLDRARHLIQSGSEIIGENELFYIALGFIHSQYLNFVLSKDKSHLQKAEEYVNRAFALNPNSARGHFLMGFIKYWRNNNEEAVREYKLSLNIEPKDPETLNMLAYFCAISGKESAAEPLFKKALEIDPLTPLIHLFYSCFQWYCGRFDTALESHTKCRQLDPENPVAMVCGPFILAYLGRLDDALNSIDRMREVAQQSIWTQLGIFLKYALEGDKAGALQSVTDELKTAMEHNNFYSLLMGECFALIGEKDLAIHWIDDASQWGFINYPYLNERAPFLESLRGEEKFQELMREIKHKWENFEV